MKQLTIVLIVFLTFSTHFAQKGLELDPLPIESVIPNTKFDAMGEAKQILDKVCSQYESFESMKVDFILTTEKGNIQKSDTVVGTVQGEKYRISMKEQEIASDGKTVYHYHKAARTLSKTLTKSDQTPAQINAVYPQRMLRSFQKEFDCYFNGEASFNGQIIQRLEFIPRAFDQKTIKINVFIDRQTSQILRVSRTDKDGTQFTFDFRNVLIDIEINPKLFVIEIS